MGVSKYDNEAKSRNKERMKIYKEFVKVQPVKTYLTEEIGA
ncbi:hypothetical protein OCA08_24305 [Bacillus cereus]|nr:hypothetical protein [Bacillus cereus]